MILNINQLPIPHNEVFDIEITDIDKSFASDKMTFSCDFGTFTINKPKIDQFNEVEIGDLLEVYLLFHVIYNNGKDTTLGRMLMAPKKMKKKFETL